MTYQTVKIQKKEGTTRWKLCLEYDGAFFHGWQTQVNSNVVKKKSHAVQDYLEFALKKLSNKAVKVTVAGRTDAGVHAKAQIVHFDLALEITPFKLCRALNAFMKNASVRVLTTQKIDSNFHARFNAKMRFYCYHVLIRKMDSPIRKNRVWHVPDKLDKSILDKATQMLIGCHDFSAFRTSGCQARSAVRNMQLLTWKAHEDELRMYAVSQAFLYQQIRIICGSVIDCARGRLSLSKLEKALKTGKRADAGITAPAQGLYLLGVDYEGDKSESVPIWLRNKLDGTC